MGCWSTIGAHGRVRARMWRLFSRLAYMKDERRNHLEEGYLNACLVLATQRIWSFEQSPLVQAIWKWADAKKCRPATYGGGCRQPSESVIVQMDEDSDGEPLS
eukprot:1158751-Pelagomonas_calceolata.AAC.5